LSIQDVNSQAQEHFQEQIIDKNYFMTKEQPI